MRVYFLLITLLSFSHNTWASHKEEDELKSGDEVPTIKLNPGMRYARPELTGVDRDIKPDINGFVAIDSRVHTEALVKPMDELAEWYGGFYRDIAWQIAAPPTKEKQLPLLNNLSSDQTPRGTFLRSIKNLKPSAPLNLFFKVGALYMKFKQFEEIIRMMPLFYKYQLETYSKPPKRSTERAKRKHRTAKGERMVKLRMKVWKGGAPNRDSIKDCITEKLGQAMAKGADFQRGLTILENLLAAATNTSNALMNLVYKQGYSIEDAMTLCYGNQKEAMEKLVPIAEEFLENLGVNHIKIGKPGLMRIKKKTVEAVLKKIDEFKTTEIGSVLFAKRG